MNQENIQVDQGHNSPSDVVIIPYIEEMRFIALCAECNLFPYKITRVKGNPTSAIVRSLLAFSRNTLAKIPTNELVIETDRHQYTADYIALTREFYLKMD
jgi:tRNA1Val (adenine37-N6)-methyltransferase